MDKKDRLAQPEPPALTGIDCSCGRRWRVENNTLTVSAQPEQEPINYEEWNYDPMTGKPLWGEQPEQEPVAWMVITMGEVTSMQPHMIAAEMLDGTHQLYTAPTREWQGLTNDEIMDACSAVWASHPIEVGQVVAAILKEKNGF